MRWVTHVALNVRSVREAETFSMGGERWTFPPTESWVTGHPGDGGRWREARVSFDAGTMGSAHETVAAVAKATSRERALIAAKRGEPMKGSSDQLSALLDAASALSSASIPYALIGGIAVGIHSEVPRATQDIDLAVVTSVAKEALVSALGSAGFELAGEHPHSINLRHASGEALQVSTDATFDEMIDRAGHVEIGGVQVRVVTKEDLIEMKERAAADPARRPSKALRDRADVELLKGDVPGPNEGW